MYFMQCSQQEEELGEDGAKNQGDFHASSLAVREGSVRAVGDPPPDCQRRYGRASSVESHNTASATSCGDAPGRVMYAAQVAPGANCTTRGEHVGQLEKAKLSSSRWCGPPFPLRFKVARARAVCFRLCVPRLTNAE